MQVQIADAAIQFCLTIKVLFKLPLRQTTGMVASLLKMTDPDWAVPHDRHLPTGHRNHPDPQERAAMERGLSGSDRQNRDPPRHPALRQGILEALDRIPCGKPDQGKDALPQAFGECINARDPDRQTAEIQIRVALMNRFSAPGTAEIVRVA